MSSPFLGKIWNMISKNGIRFSTLPMPMMDPLKLNDLSTVSYSDLETGYREKLSVLKMEIDSEIERIVSQGKKLRTGSGTIPPFGINISGSNFVFIEIAAALEAIVDAVNSKSIPNLNARFEEIVAKVREEAKDLVVRRYETTMKQALVLFLEAL